ncbi:MAG: cytochrome-c peroxidase, partial [Bacteroidia bacterium]
DGKNQVVFNNLVTSCTTSTVTATVLTSNYSVTTTDTITSTTTTCLEELIQAAVFTNPVKIPFITTGEMNIGLQEAVRRISALPYYSDLFSKAFPGNPTPVTQANIEIALGVFMDNIVSGNSKFDMVNNGSAQFTPEEADGQDVFNGKGKCSLCHRADNNFAGKAGQFEDIGLDLSYIDQGRKRLTNLSSDEGRFHVPSLKNVSLSAPYMHDGRFRTLNEVVEFFDNGVQQSANLSSAMSAHPTPDGNGGFTSGGHNFQPLLLTSTEKEHLVEFLKTLTDYTIINDKKLSDPFKH